MKSRRSGVFAWGVVLLTLGLLLTGTWLLTTQFLAPKVNVSIGGSVIDAQLARTEQERELGLGGVTSLGPRQGMLFVFDSDGPQPIWMKGMKIDIDIVWLNADKRVVSIARNVEPSSYPKEFKSPQPARYVLELAAGGARQASIATGQIASFDLP